MPSPTEITVSQLSRLIGLPDAPAHHRRAHRRGLRRRPAPDPWLASPRLPHGCAVGARATAGRSVIVTCQKGLKLSQGAAAWLRHEGIDAETLEGGFEAWRRPAQLLVRTDKLPARDEQGRTVWVTRARPKIDRIACPWLIRRFVDPGAVFLFVAPSEVLAVAERFDATPFDIDGVFWSHRGETCTFDTMLEEFGLESEPLLQLAAHRARRRHGPARPGAAVGRPARRLARLFAHVPRRPRAARRGDGALRCLLSLVP